MRRTIEADHGQFYVADVEGQAAAEADDDYDWPEAWSDEAVTSHYLGVDGPSSIAVGTARSDHVETALRIHAERPPVAEADHVVEADLAVPTGAVHVFGCMGTPAPRHRVDVPAGHYRLRVSRIPSRPPAGLPVTADPGPHFVYQLDLWPSDPGRGVRVVKQG